jgi:hypothetical protein
MREKSSAIVLRFDTKKFGAPDDTTRQAIEQITDLDRLDRMTDRIDEVTTWADLLGTA